jgi:hypothetical protein
MAQTQKIRSAFHPRPSRQLFLCPITNFPCEAIFHIYAKTTAAPVKEACRRAPMKIREPRFLWSSPSRTERALPVMPANVC